MWIITNVFTEDQAISQNVKTTDRGGDHILTDQNPAQKPWVWIFIWLLFWHIPYHTIPPSLPWQWQSLMATASPGRKMHRKGQPQFFSGGTWQKCPKPNPTEHQQDALEQAWAIKPAPLKPTGPEKSCWQCSASRHYRMSCVRVDISVLLCNKVL